MGIQIPPELTPATGQIWTVAKNDLSWLQKHERIVIVAFVLLSGTFVCNKFLNWESSQKDSKVIALTAQVAQDKQNVENLAISASQAQAVYQTTLDAITKQNASLSAAVAQESSILAQRQRTDSQLPLPELAQRIEVLAPGTQGRITATSTGLSLDSTASVAVAQMLEQVPVLTAQLDNEAQIVQNTSQILDKANDLNGILSNQVSGLNKELADKSAQCTAEVAAEKVKTKKAFVKGLKYGFVAGLAAGAWLIHAL